MEREYGKEDLEIQINMKENTTMIRKMVMGFLFGQMVIFIKAIFNTIKNMVTIKCIGTMGHHIKGSGKTIIKLDSLRKILILKIKDL